VLYRDPGLVVPGVERASLGRATALAVFDNGNATAGDFTLANSRLELRTTFMKAANYSENDYCCVVHGARGISTTGVEQPGGTLRIELIP
jgi:hypothetical protein